MIQPIYLYGSEVLREVAAPADLSKKEELTSGGLDCEAPEDEKKEDDSSVIASF